MATRKRKENYSKIDGIPAAERLAKVTPKQFDMLTMFSPREVKTMVEVGLPKSGLFARWSRRDKAIFWTQIFEAWWESRAKLKSVIAEMRESSQRGMTNRHGEFLQELLDHRPQFDRTKRPREKPKQIPRRRVVEAERVSDLTNGQLLRMIADPSTTTETLDEIWRETRARKWPREEMAVFDEVKK